MSVQSGVGEVHAVIMAGGGGLRFWPLSSSLRPKQFLDLTGSGETLLQQTYRRALGIAEAENVWVITSVEHRDQVLAQLPGAAASRVIGEPYRRNTGPCVALASALVPEEASLVFLPSDHRVDDEALFYADLELALSVSAEPGMSVTIGVAPRRAETGYGYIAVGSALPGYAGAYQVEGFREKPSAALAQRYSTDGRHLWNSGVFVWQNVTLRSLLSRYAGGIWERVRVLVEEPCRDLEPLYRGVESISVDYALLERVPDIAVVRSRFGWDDLGSYTSLLTRLDRDEYGNHVGGGGRCVLEGCHGNLVLAPEDEHIIVVGLSDYVVVRTDEGLLICPLGREQEIREFVTRLGTGGV